MSNPEAFIPTRAPVHACLLSSHLPMFIREEVLQAL